MVEEMLRVCIIQPGKDRYTHTYLRYHRERLPAQVRLLYGGSFPLYLEDGTSLLSFFDKAADATLKHLFRTQSNYFRRRSLKKFLQKHKVNVVLAEYGPTGTQIVDTCVEAHIPMVVHFHGGDASNREILETYGRDYRRMFSLAAAIVVVSRAIEEELLSMGAPKEKLFYNSLGVDCSLFKDSNPESSPPIFLAVGRFVDKKAPLLTLLAFKRVIEQCPQARLIMVGEGVLLEACKQMAEAFDISRNVEFLGAQTPSEVANIMRKVRVFVQHSLRPSSGDLEGMPVSVIEACASGLPVISTFHSGIPEVIRHGETGFLVKEGDYEGMSHYMNRLAGDPVLAKNLGEKAQKRIREEFTIEKSIEGLFKILSSAADHKSK